MKISYPAGSLATNTAMASSLPCRFAIAGLPDQRIASCATRSETGKCAIHLGEERGAAGRSGAVDVGERQEAGRHATLAEPGEAAEQHGAHGIAQHQLHQPPR